MTDAEAMKNFARLQREVHVLSRQYTRMLAESDGPGEVRGANPRRGRRTNEPGYARMQHFDLLEKHLREAETRYTEAQNGFDRVLKGVKSPLMKSLLIEYYGLGRTDSQVAEDLEMSQRNVNRMRHTFLRHLDYLENQRENGEEQP